MIQKISLLSLPVLLFMSGCEENSPEGKPIDVITVTPLQSLLEIGETVQFTATARDVDLNIIGEASFTWVSSHPQAVAVDENGLATGRAMARDVVITATAEGVESNDAVLHVVGVPASINLGSTPEAVVVGKQVPLSAAIRDALGTEIPGAEISAWTSADGAVLTVEQDGVVTGIAKGLTTVTASSAGLNSEPLRIYVWDVVFREDFSAVDTATISTGYFRGKNGILWQINHELKTDTSATGPYTGIPAIIEENGNPVLRLTDPSSAYFTNRQMLIMTYGNSNYDTDYMWPGGDGVLTNSNFRVQMRIKGMDDPVAGTTSESLAIFTQYFAGAASPYYLVYAPGRNRVSAWFGASLASGASIPEWGAMPEIDYNQWFNLVLEVFEGTMRTEIFTGAEPTGAWDYSYTIPDWTGTEEDIPGFWFGTFLVDEYYADDIIYYTP